MVTTFLAGLRRAVRLRDGFLLLCTHEQVHLADGLVMDYEIECPKHNATFDSRTGEAKRAPACVNLNTYPAKTESGRVLIDI